MGLLGEEVQPQVWGTKGRGGLLSLEEGMSLIYMFLLLLF